MKEKKIVYDVETMRGPDEVEGGWDNPAGMGFGCAVAYDITADVFGFYGPDDKQQLIDLLYNQTVISFNGIKFDNSVLLGNDYKPQWNDIDLLNEVIKAKFGTANIPDAVKQFGARKVFDTSVNLDGLAGGTLGKYKTGHGAHAPVLLKEGRWAELFEYNLNDVRLTYKLFMFAKRYRFLVDRNRQIVRLDSSIIINEK